VPVWRRIQPSLEPDIQKNRDNRLAYERKLLIWSREDAIKIYYSWYRSLTYTSKPIKDCFLLPRDWDVFQIENVARVIHREDDRILNDLDDDFVELKASLPVLLQNWMDARTLDMAGKLPTATSSNIAFTSNIGRHELGSTARSRLALSVFRCSTKGCRNALEDPPQVLIGWEDAIAHHCCLQSPWTCARDVREPTKTNVEYDARGSAAVTSVVLLFNLDPHNTIPSILDKMDPRIMCVTCPIRERRGIRGRLALSWREAVRFLLF
jgi:hypothetical protein